MATVHARPTTTWLPESIVYQIYLRAFTPEGTLCAAMERLPELAELGVDILYLCPVCLHDDDPREAFWSPRQRASGCNNPKNPYRMKDYYAVDPEYGNDTDLQAFVDAAHELGMRVLLDIVFLHCGPQAVFLAEHPDFVERDEKGEIAVGQWNFPMINFANPELREYLWCNLEYWITSFGVDGYRCDVSCNIPLDFWEEARRRLEAIAPDVVMLAESGKPEEQHFAFDFSYSFSQVATLYEIMAGNEPASAFRTKWEELRNQWPEGSRFIRYTDNHDLANDKPPRIEGEWGAAGVKATLALSFAVDGVPMLYNGQEVADSACHSIYANWPVDWTRGDQPVGQERRELCRKLCALRHSQPVLCHGDMQWLDNDRPDEVLSFMRTHEGVRILAVVSLVDQPVSVTVNVPDATKGMRPLIEAGVTSRMNSTAWQSDLDGFAYFIGKAG